MLTRQSLTTEMPHVNVVVHPESKGRVKDNHGATETEDPTEGVITDYLEHDL